MKINLGRKLCWLGLHKNEIVIDEEMTEEWKRILDVLDWRFLPKPQVNPCCKLKCVRCGKETPGSGDGVVSLGFKGSWRMETKRNKHA